VHSTQQWKLPNSPESFTLNNPSFLKKLVIAGLLSSGFTATLLMNATAALASPKMPWPSSYSANVTQTAHGARGRAFDLGLRAGTPVLAPEDVTVVSQCIARGTTNHRAIQLQRADGQRYWLIHVSAGQLKSSYLQGEQIGVVAGDLPNDPNCAVSYGVHLHMELPALPFTIDGQTLSRNTQLGTILRSTNQPSQQPQLAFAQPVSSGLRISQSALDLSVNASNLSGRRVYVQMWRAAALGYGEREWNTSGVSSGNSIVFNDLDGSGDTFSGVTYYTVASLSPIPPGTARQMRNGCFTVTNGQQLCDSARR
jgi:hypothetical protein